MIRPPTYIDFEAKLDSFHLSKVETIEEFRELANTHEHSLGIYRGVSSSAYKIFTSLQRQIIQAGIQNTFSTDKYLRNLKNNKLLNKYFCMLKVVPSKLSIYSYLQHYGAPTPFLDFTKSFKIALYFATENFDSSKYQESSLIDDYFSIFFIQQSDLEILAIPEVINSLKEIKSSARTAFSSYYDDSLDEFLTSQADSLLGINLSEVF